MTNIYYGSDDARNLSPPLEAQKIDYKPHVTPPPFISEGNQSPEKGKPGSTGRDCAGQPNIVEQILTGLQQEPQECHRDSSDSEGSVTRQDLKRERRNSFTDFKKESGSSSVPSQDTGTSLPPLKSEKSFNDDDPIVLPRISQLESIAREGEGIRSMGGILGPSQHTIPGPSLPPIATDFHRGSSRPFALPASNRTAAETLPALQSPPHSAAANSPETFLPSIKARFADELSETRLMANGASPLYLPPTSPSHNRPAPPPSEHVMARSEPFIQPHPASGSPYMPPPRTNSNEMSSLASTPTAVNHASPWGSHPKSDRSYTLSAGDANSQMADSPVAAGYPTPTEGPRTGESPEQISRSELPASNAATPNPGGFKCTFAGCNAPPFQTQYLLNSHANVHSHDRPYFCPVKGCPRAEGGKGFKRKNEMIRHGLVHDSPGYVCPFCHDQQHKYPRPDNLQRHVRVHHVDKSKDDPLLRRVLAQRPEGLSRGRKRRI